MGKAVYMTETTALSEALYQHLTGQMGRVKGGIQETEAVVPVPKSLWLHERNKTSLLGMLMRLLLDTWGNQGNCRKEAQLKRP